KITVVEFDGDGGFYMAVGSSGRKPQVEVKSFPAELINPLACNTDGTYIVGGGVSSSIYIWEVFSMDQSLLISGGDDGSMRVWSLLMIRIFDEERQQRAGHLYEYSFSDHALPVTDIVAGYEGSNAIIVSSSQDRTCKVWSLARGTMLRNTVFPSVIDVVALDPGKHVFVMLVVEMERYTLQN
ncbi:protein root initiation defective 3, partial [Tanacetum coccineum]